MTLRLLTDREWPGHHSKFLRCFHPHLFLLLTISMLDWSSIQLHHYLQFIVAKFDGHQKKWQKPLIQLFGYFHQSETGNFLKTSKLEIKVTIYSSLATLHFHLRFLIIIDLYWHLAQPCWWSPCSRWYARIGSMRRECPRKVVVVRNAPQGLDPTPPLDCSHLTFNTDNSVHSSNLDIKIWQMQNLYLALSPLQLPWNTSARVALVCFCPPTPIVEKEHLLMLKICLILYDFEIRNLVDPMLLKYH